MNLIKNKILKAIKNGRLSLVLGSKKRYNYFLEIQKLYTSRNNKDGYKIHIYDPQMHHLDTVDLCWKPIINSRCVGFELELG